MVLEDPRREGRRLLLGDNGVCDDASDQTDQLGCPRICPALVVPCEGKRLAVRSNRMVPPPT